MARYVDGFVIPVLIANVKAYQQMSKKASRIWMDHGALEYIETVADDVKPGKLTSFPQAVNLQEGETVVFAWIIYKSRKHRDKVNAAVMADPRMEAFAKMPQIFDAKRMIYGGFKTIVEVLA